MPNVTRDDPSETARIASLTALTRELGQSRKPAETLRTVRRALADMYGPTTSIMLSTRGLDEGEYRPVQVSLEGAAASDDADPWAQESLAVQRGGVIAQIIRKPQPQILRGVDWAADPYYHSSLAGYDSVAAIPFAADRLPISWVLLLRRSPASFAPSEFEQALLRTTLIGSLLESQTLNEQVAQAHALIDREVRRVGQIQRNLLPDPLPRVPGLEIAASYETFGEAGGDLYDFVPLGGAGPDQEPWAIFIGDASGHGPSAAVVIAIVQALLHAHPPGAAGPGALLRHLNRHLCRRPIESSFVTAFVGVFDPPTRRFTYACAGHPPPILLRASPRTVTTLDSVGACPLGIDADADFEEAGIALDRGDGLLLYTDGIQEALDPSGTMFGIEGIQAAVHRDFRTPHQFVPTIRQDVAAHTGGRHPTDDQTLVALSVL